MIKLLIALLAAALLVAGCGGDDDEADTPDAGTTAQTQPQTTPTDTGEETTPEDEGEDGESTDGDDAAPRGTPRQLEEAVESCKDNVRQAPQLSDDAKDDLVELCEQAASGDPEELREVSREVCRRIIADTLPEGEQREQALRLCDQTGE